MTALREVDEGKVEEAMRVRRTRTAVETMGSAERDQAECGGKWEETERRTMRTLKKLDQRLEAL